MLALFFSHPLTFLVLFPGLLLAITVHEFSHAWTADQLGDPTPRSQGRLTLDPRAHLDPLGTLAILITRFGWGKPVQFDPFNLKEPLRDTALIALAGPVSNLIMAVLISVVINLGLIPVLWLNAALAQVLIINIILAIFNLVPIYPLDGSKIMLAFLPRDMAHEYDLIMHRYGMLILILLIFPLFGGVSPVSQLISPVINLVVGLLI